MPTNPPRAPGELAEIKHRAFAESMRAWGENDPNPEWFADDCLGMMLADCGRAGALIDTLLDEIASLRSATGDGGEAMGWRPIETAPRDGTPIWAYLFDSGIRQVKWLSVEAIIAEEGGSPEDWQEGFYEVEEDDNEWAPLFWLPLDALPVPPALQPRSTKIDGAGDNA